MCVSKTGLRTTFLSLLILDQMSAQNLMQPVHFHMTFYQQHVTDFHELTWKMVLCLDCLFLESLLRMSFHFLFH